MILFVVASKEFKKEECITLECGEWPLKEDAPRRVGGLPQYGLLPGRPYIFLI